MSLKSVADLRKPATSRVLHSYGLCHEVGHLAMYRPIQDHGWVSTGGAEGWAHYLSSVLVDEIYAIEGAKLWPDAYDYRADGVRSLDEQLNHWLLESIVWRNAIEFESGHGYQQAPKIVLSKIERRHTYSAIRLLICAAEAENGVEPPLQRRGDAPKMRSVNSIPR